jgi:uncharacterized protein
MFKKERDNMKFVWSDLGDLEKGRPNLGLSVPVLAYRLLQYTFRDVIISELGVKNANNIYQVPISTFWKVSGRYVVTVTK